MIVHYKLPIGSPQLNFSASTLHFLLNCFTGKSCTKWGISYTLLNSFAIELLKEIYQKDNLNDGEMWKKCNFSIDVNICYFKHLMLILCYPFDSTCILLKNSNLMLILFWLCFKHNQLCPESSNVNFNIYFRGWKN